MTQAPPVPWEIFAFIFSTAASLYAWFTARQGRTDRRLAKLENTMSVVTERITHLPTERDVNALNVSLERNTGAVSRLGERLEAAINRIDLHEEWLKTESKR